MSDVVDYIHVSSVDTRRRLAKFYALECEEIARLVSATLEAIRGYRRAEPFVAQAPRQIADGLMVKGGTTLMAALELSLSGYMWEPGSLLRNVLEIYATAWDLVESPDRHQRWINGKRFDSTDSISRVKALFPAIGPLNGYLSRMHVHVGPENGMPSVFTMNGLAEVQFFGQIPEGKEGIRVTEIHSCVLTAYLCLQLAERAFAPYVGMPETFTFGTKSLHAKMSARHRPFAERALKHFQALTRDPVGHL